MESLKQLDLFQTRPSDPEVMQVRSTSGAVVSVVSILAMLVLFGTELGLYLHTDTVNHLVVDQHASTTRFDATMSVSFFRVPCSALEIALHDSKNQELDATMAVEKKDWRAPDQAPDADPAGCTLDASLNIPRVGGKAVFTSNVGGNVPSIQQGSMSINSALSAMNFNSSHIINSLSFGPSLPASLATSSALEGVNKTHANGLMAYDYYTKLVPTQFTPLSGEVVRTHQYAATEFTQSAGLQGHHIIKPAVSLNYDFTPILVKHEEHRRTFLQFLVSLCAIVGGVFTVSGMLNSTLYASSRLMNKLK